jgi:hypothetical protein
MTGMPIDSTEAGVSGRVARSLTDAALAQRLDAVAFNRRSFARIPTDAFLAEAARRLRWDLLDGRERPAPTVVED